MIARTLRHLIAVSASRNETDIDLAGYGYQMSI